MRSKITKEQSSELAPFGLVLSHNPRSHAIAIRGKRDEGQIQFLKEKGLDKIA
jgi:hypothetical protein